MISTEKVLESYKENNIELKQVIKNSINICENYKNEDHSNKKTSQNPMSSTGENTRTNIVENDNEKVKTFFMKKRINEFEQKITLNNQIRNFTIFCSTMFFVL